MTIEGIKTYANFYADFKRLFSATFVVISAYIALKTYVSMENANDIANNALSASKATNETATQSLTAMLDSNSIATDALQQMIENNMIMKKENEFIEWKYKIEYRMSQYFQKNPNNDKLMVIFTQNRREIFNQLYEAEFTIKDKNQLQDFFEKYFAQHIDLIELSSEHFIPCHCLYPSKSYAYSLDCARYLFLGLVNLGNCYKKISEDFTNFYLDKVHNGNEPRMVNSTEYFHLFNQYKNSRISNS